MSDIGAEHVLAMVKYPYTSESYKLILTDTKNYGLQSSELTYDEMTNSSDSVMEYLAKYCMDSDGNFTNTGTKECADVYFVRAGVKFAKGKYFSDIAIKIHLMINVLIVVLTYNLSRNTYEHINVYICSKEYQNYLVNLGISSAVVPIPDMSQMKALGCTGIGTGFCPSSIPSRLTSSSYWLNFCSSDSCYYTLDGELSRQTIEDNYHPFRPAVSFKRSEL